MKIDGQQVVLDIAGIGIIFYSPKCAEHIPEGTDYLETNYTSEKHVQDHIQRGTIVGFGTCSAGRFILRFHSGYPSDELLRAADFRLRLGLTCVGGIVCFRDLYDLLDWRKDCPHDQQLRLDDGLYHVTLCSSRPASGVLGDDQVIDFHLQRLARFPELAKQGIPTLCV